MSELNIKEKDIVVPGEELATGMDYIPSSGTYRDGEKIIAMQVGMVSINGRVLKVIALKGKYAPKQGDTVIGRVMDMTFSNWFVDIHCPSLAILSSREIGDFVERGEDLSIFYSFGDLIMAKVAKVTRNSVELTMKGPGLRKLGPGRLLYVNPSKVPRIIGKQGSMITLIKEKTGCRVSAGQNGLIWIQGEPQAELLAFHVIQKIDRESHKSGLTDEIGKYIETHAKGLQVPEKTIVEQKVEQHDDI